jgi:hypothetical protein
MVEAARRFVSLPSATRHVVRKMETERVRKSGTKVDDSQLYL